MGIFANEAPEGPGWIDFKPKAEDGARYSGFEAMGHKVPFFRRSAADAALKSMGVTDAEKRMDCIGKMSDRIERDDPNGAMEAGHKFVDVTGVYRLLAVLTCAEKPADA